MSSISPLIRCAAAIVLLSCTPTRAEEIFTFLRPPPQMQIAPQAASPTSLNPARDDQDENVQLPARLQRQIVAYSSREAPGTVIIDTPHTYLYYVLGNGKAIRYGIGVGRDGFTWSGVQVDCPQDRMAGLVSAAGDDRSSALSAALHGGRPRQSAGRARDVSRRYRLSHSRHQRSVDRSASTYRAAAFG